MAKGNAGAVQSPLSWFKCRSGLQSFSGGSVSIIGSVATGLKGGSVTDRRQNRAAPPSGAYRPFANLR
jgi:hypothetical protein